MTCLLIREVLSQVISWLDYLLSLNPDFIRSKCETGLFLHQALIVATLRSPVYSSQKWQKEIPDKTKDESSKTLNKYLNVQQAAKVVKRVCDGTLVPDDFRLSEKLGECLVRASWEQICRYELLAWGSLCFMAVIFSQLWDYSLTLNRLLSRCWRSSFSGTNQLNWGRKHWQDCQT